MTNEKIGCCKDLGQWHFGEKVRCGDNIMGLRLCSECQEKQMRKKQINGGGG